MKRSVGCEPPFVCGMVAHLAPSARASQPLSAERGQFQTHGENLGNGGGWPVESWSNEVPADRLIEFRFVPTQYTAAHRWCLPIRFPSASAWCAADWRRPMAYGSAGAIRYSSVQRARHVYVQPPRRRGGALESGGTAGGGRRAAISPCTADDSASTTSSKTGWSGSTPL